MGHRIGTAIVWVLIATGIATWSIGIGLAVGCTMDGAKCYLKIERKH